MTPQEFLESKGISKLSLVKDPEGEYYSLVETLSEFSVAILSLAAEKADVQIESDLFGEITVVKDYGENG